MLRPLFAVLPLDIRSLGYRARAAAWGRADAALSGVWRFSAATARRGVARVLRPVAALPGCVARAAAFCAFCSTCAAGSGVQRFCRRFSCDFRLGASLGFVSVTPSGVLKQFRFLTCGAGSNPESRVFQITNSGGVLLPMSPSRRDLGVSGSIPLSLI